MIKEISLFAAFGFPLVFASGTFALALALSSGRAFFADDQNDSDADGYGKHTWALT